MTSSRSGLVTGIIYFDFGEHQFPESKWDDAIVVIVGWWLSALMDLVTGQVARTELRFMDGPLWISIQRKAHDRCAMSCIGSSGESIGFEHESSVLVLLDAVHIVAAQIQEVCSRNGWHSADMETLENRINAARVLLGQQ